MIKHLSEELERDIRRGRVYLGGCRITENDPKWHCNACGCEFGRRN